MEFVLNGMEIQWIHQIQHDIGVNLKILSLTSVLLDRWYIPSLLDKRLQDQIVFLIIYIMSLTSTNLMKTFKKNEWYIN